MISAAGKTFWEVRKIRIAIVLLFCPLVFLSEIPARPLFNLTDRAQATLKRAAEEPHAAEQEQSITGLRTLVEQKRWEEAQQLGQKLLELYPKNPELFYLNGVSLFQLSDSFGAIRSLRRAETLGLNTLSFHKSLGIAYYSLQQYKLFREQMEKALAIVPDEYEVYYYLGRYYESVANDYLLALHYFDRSINSKPDFEKSVYYRGYCYEMMGQKTEALDNYERAVQLTDKNEAPFSWPYQALGRLLLESQPDKALTLALRAAAVEPDLESNHLLLAKIYERKNDLNQSLAELRNASRLNPAAASTRYIIFRMLSRLGRREEAKDELLIFQKIKSTYGDQ